MPVSKDLPISRSVHMVWSSTKVHVCESFEYGRYSKICGGQGGAVSTGFLAGAARGRHAH